MPAIIAPTEPGQGLAQMRHRIRSAALIVKDGAILLVKHRHPRTGVEWWVPPGGGLEEGESVFDCARRETLEETAIDVDLGEVMYLNEFVDLELAVHNLEVFILTKDFRGVPSTKNVKAGDEDAKYIQDARFVSAEGMKSLTVYPEVLREQFWHDLALRPLPFKYLGQQVKNTTGHDLA